MDTSYLENLRSKVTYGQNVFVAPTATVIGSVTLGDFVSIWYGAVLRADFDEILIGSHTNVQETVIMHVDPGMPINIGCHNVIGHGAIIHGCTIGDFNLIGMRSTIMNGAKIGKGCIIGAHTLITENKVIPDYSLVMGSPGKIVKQIPPNTIDLIKLGTKEYQEEAARYLANPDSNSNHY